MLWDGCGMGGLCVWWCGVGWCVWWDGCGMDVGWEGVWNGMVCVVGWIWDGRVMCVWWCGVGWCVWWDGYGMGGLCVCGGVVWDGVCGGMGVGWQGVCVKMSKLEAGVERSGEKHRVNKVRQEKYS